MRRKYLSVALVIALAGSTLFSSCIGSFQLTHKLLDWNQGIGSKFVNELVFLAFWILPVYEVSGLADILVLNSIEFWSGENPVAQDSRIIEGSDGKYLVESDAKGYTITSQNDGTVVRLNFNEDNKEWSATVGEQTFTLFSFVDDTHVKIIAPDGDYQTVELSDMGVLAYRQMVQTTNLAQR